MERIDKIAQQVSTRTSSTTSRHSEKVLDQDRLKRIFAIFQVNYGSLWVNSIETKELLNIAFDVWGKKLFGLTDMQIKNGLDSLPEGPYPPNPIAFYNLCAGNHSGLGHNTAAYKPVDKTLRLEKKADKEAARKALDEIRGIIRD